MELLQNGFATPPQATPLKIQWDSRFGLAVLQSWRWRLVQTYPYPLASPVTPPPPPPPPELVDYHDDCTTSIILALGLWPKLLFTTDTENLLTLEPGNRRWNELRSIDPIEKRDKDLFLEFAV